MTHVPPDASDPDDAHGQVVLQWDSSPHADCTADAVVAVLLQEQGPPHSIGVAEAERQCASARVSAVGAAFVVDAFDARMLLRKCRAAAARSGRARALCCCVSELAR